MDSPPLWRKHLAPYYERRIAQLRAAGKYTYIHIDGAMKRLLREIRASSFDGIEACTPLPQGDVSLAEIQEALGEKVLLDGIPAIFFLEHYDWADIESCTREVVERFYPRLILGISDELPPDADIERVRRVGELVQSLV
jgi:uroporphyrinogen-III decarboxylase